VDKRDPRNPPKCPLYPELREGMRAVYQSTRYKLFGGRARPCILVNVYRSGLARVKFDDDGEVHTVRLASVRLK
jgi:hypothetical protein